MSMCDKVEVLDPVVGPIVSIKLLDKLSHSATDPISKCTFPFWLHLLTHLWLYDGLVARDYDRMSFLSNASNASRIRPIVHLLGRSSFPHSQEVVPSNTYFEQEGH